MIFLSTNGLELDIFKLCIDWEGVNPLPKDNYLAFFHKVCKDFKLKVKMRKCWFLALFHPFIPQGFSKISDCIWIVKQISSL